jgi:hypothetical protein
MDGYGYGYLKTYSHQRLHCSPPNAMLQELMNLGEVILVDPEAEKCQVNGLAA